MKEKINRNCNSETTTIGISIFFRNIACKEATDRQMSEMDIQTITAQ